MDMDVRPPQHNQGPFEPQPRNAVQAPAVDPTPPEPAPDPFRPDNPPSNGDVLPPSVKMHRRNGKGRKLLNFVLVLLLIAAAAGGVYYWQHQKVTDAASQASTLQSQNATQAAKIASLNKQLTAATAASTPKTAAPIDQTAAITAAVKAYKDNTKNAAKMTITISGVTASGNAAYGGRAVTGNDGNAQWLAVNTKGVWAVVSQGTTGICQAQIKQYSLPAIWAGASPSC